MVFGRLMTALNGSSNNRGSPNRAMSKSRSKSGMSSCFNDAELIPFAMPRTLGAYFRSIQVQSKGKNKVMLDNGKMAKNALAMDMADYQLLQVVCYKLLSQEMEHMFGITPEQLSQVFAGHASFADLINARGAVGTESAMTSAATISAVAASLASGNHPSMTPRRALSLLPQPLAQQQQASQPEVYGIFGTPLNQLDRNVVSVECGLPMVIVRVMQELYHKCDRAEGIFRVEGNPARIEAIISMVRDGFEPEYFSLEQESVNDLAAVLKRYIRSIPGSLIPQPYVDMLLCLKSVLDTESRLYLIQLVLFLLPFEHLRALVPLLWFLDGISEHEKGNRMSATNLAIIFTPNVFATERNWDGIKWLTNLLADLIKRRDMVFSVPDHIKRRCLKEYAVIAGRSGNSCSASTTIMMDGGEDGRSYYE